MTPPLQVLQTALTHPERLEIHSSLDTEDYEYRVFLYFLELNSTVKEGKRVFDIYVNGEIQREKFDILAKGSNYTYTVLNVSANGLLNLTLVKSSGAEFGPLLNAYEILQKRSWIEETNQKDGRCVCVVFLHFWVGLLHLVRIWINFSLRISRRESEEKNFYKLKSFYTN